MNKIVNCFLFMVVTLISSQAYSGITQSSLTDYVLKPAEPLNLINTLPNTLSAQCQIQAVSTVINSISIKVLRGNGVFNGTTLKQGETLVQTVTNMQLIPIVASSGAQAQFTNLGPYVVKATCL